MCGEIGEDATYYFILTVLMHVSWFFRYFQNWVDVSPHILLEHLTVSKWSEHLNLIYFACRQELEQNEIGASISSGKIDHEIAHIVY